MKQLILFITIFFLILIDLYPQNSGWTVIDSVTNTGGNYYGGLKCADSMNCMGWIWFGSGGDILRRTTDGGLSWKNVYYNSSSYLKAINYPEANLFIAVGSAGLIIRTTDMGETWEKTVDTNFSIFSRIVLFDKYFGIIQGWKKGTEEGDSNLIHLKTIDGGKTWQKLKFPINVDFDELNFIDLNLVYGIGQSITKEKKWKYYFIRIYDNFDKIDTLAPPDSGSHLSFISPNLGWVGGGWMDYNNLENTTQYIAKTEDGGQSWQTQRNLRKNSCPLFCIKFIDENYGMATSCDGLVLITTNGGKKWQENTILKLDYKSGFDYALRELQIISKNTVYLTCSGWYVYKFNGDWTDDVEEPSKPRELTLFPNPVTDFINLPKFTKLSKVKIYSILGILIYESEYSDKIDVSSLLAGVYYVRIGDYIIKFIKI